MTEVQERHSEGAEPALVSAVVRVKGPDGSIGGAGFLIAPDLVLTCAHVVSDALDRPREDTVEAGTEVTVDVPLAGNAEGVDGGDHGAEVQRWIPIRPDQTGDIAVLRLRNGIPGARPLPMVDPQRGVWDHDARAVGFTDDNPDGIWQSGRFRGPTRQGWIQLSRANGEAVYVKGGFSGSPVWDNELGAAVGMMVAAQPVRDAQQAFVLRMRTLLKEVPELAPFVSPATPFRGLSTFQEDDSEVFFGRDEDIERVVTALRGDQPTVTVYGPSGCGKSSLALAGVVPRMRQDDYLILQVNAAHFSSLRAALATELFEIVLSGQYGPPRARSAMEVEVLLADLGLADTVHRVLGSPACRLLVVLDQAEALLDSSEAVAEEVAGLLFSERQQVGVRVLVTLRADFMDAALNHTRLGSALKRGLTVPLTPMSRDQLAEVISEPVKRIAAVEYDPGLERRILDDAGSEPGILPLLGFVLAQLWDHKAIGRLRTATYEENEGVAGALRLHAEQAWKECVAKGHKGKERDGGKGEGEDERKREALRLLTGLVRVLPGSEAPLRRMLTRKEAGEARWRIAESLAARRLLVLHGDEGEPQSVELAHEALISAWPTLAQQTKADGEFLAGRAELEHDRNRWQRANRSPDLLPGSFQLLFFRRRLHGREVELAPEEREFLDLSEQHHCVRRNRIRAAWTAAALVLALIAGLGTFLVYQSKVSTQREAEGRSRSLASLSDELTKREPGLAALVAIAAHDVAPTQEARNALLRRYDFFKNYTWALTGTESPVHDVATSTDGAVTLVTTEVGGGSSGQSGAVLFVRGTRGRVHREYLPLAQEVLYPMVNGDGRRIAYLSAREGGTLVWHDVHRDGKDVLGPAHTIRSADFKMPYGQGLDFADFSPDASKVVRVVNGRTRIWDLVTGKGRVLASRVPALQKAWFGPDENTLVAQTRSGAGRDAETSVLAVDIRTGMTRMLVSGVPVTESVQPHLVMSGDGGVLALCQGRGEKGVVYRAVRVTDGRVLTTYDPNAYEPDSTQTNCSGGISMDGTGDHFALRKARREWSLIDTRPGKEVESAEGPDSDGIDVNADLPLIGKPGDWVLVTWDKTAVTGRPLYVGTTDADSPPVLLGNGNKMLLRAGENGDQLRLVSMNVHGNEKTLEKVNRPPRDQSRDLYREPPEVEVNQAETLAADLIGPNRIQVWALPSLRQVTDITTAKPPVDKAGKTTAEVKLHFLGDDELLTISGSRIDHWNAQTGQRLSKTIDVRDLGLTEKNPPQFTVNRYPKPGYAQIMIKGSPVVHAVNLRTGKEDRALRLRFSPQVREAMLNSNGRYAAVLTTGNMMEIWSVRPGRRMERVLGPFGPLQAYGRFRARFLRDGSEMFLANGNSVRIEDAADPGAGDSYNFAEDQEFLASTEDGKTLLRVDGNGHVDLLRLDPELWKNQLCDVLGRDLTEDELRGLPRWLPSGICPA
ncbi:nSTAND1 domain-containing NTPase [Streptomyces atratus]|uniref:nSTAND1 domain-containing NTPase n=1 Tax=Streptomyces atratus TaxID=1893 RepID=UPI00225BC417|nr:trypsin-like peptidase domain-containing protein [Streptomyces atratus]MCX5346092.1 trypsin-like peptidase domain-containing protein [Streptomyces atratus]